MDHVVLRALSLTLTRVVTDILIDHVRNYCTEVHGNHISIQICVHRYLMDTIVVSEIF